MRLDIVNIPS